MEPLRQLPRYKVADFLRLDLDEQWRHELIDGRIVSMSPPGSAHQVLHGRLAGYAFSALQAGHPHCSLRPQAGIAVEGLQGSQWYEADLTVTCTPPQPGDQGILTDPILIIEILSPTTDRKDKLIKLPRYKTLRSVHEILYVESEKVEMTLHRRRSDQQWDEPAILGAADMLTLQSIDMAIAVAGLYAGTGLRI